MNKKTLYLILIFAYIAAMFYLALTPSVPGNFPTNTDKLVHATEFFILTLIVLKASQIYKIKHTTLIVVVLFFVALSTELAQLLTANRTFSFLDLLADSIGIALGFGFKKILFD